MEMKVKIVTTDFIQPSSPNPSHPKLHKLSLLDQLAPPKYIPIVLYYPAAVAQQQSSILQQLKKSLSNTLNHVYPLAGRICANRYWIDCSSATNTANGVPFKEAITVMDLEEVVTKRDLEMVFPLLPAEGLCEDAGTIPLQIQATFFPCGGVAIGICASHLVVDAAALSEFVRSWAIMSLERVPLMPPDLFVIQSLLPPSNLIKPQQRPKIDSNPLSKSFVFSSTSIAALKLKAAAAHGQSQPTRVQAVTSLVWKCMMNAVSKSKSTNSSTKGNTSSILVVFVNMRTRLDPPLPQNSFGNFVGSFNIQKDYEDGNISSTNLSDLTDMQKYGLKDFCNNNIKRLNVNDEHARSSVVLEFKEVSRKTYARQDVDLFTVSSWCGFKFYELDFGWGKPIWASTNYCLTNFFLLMDTKEGDGVEAWVSLEKEDMAAFEQDEELLSFSSPPTTTPSVLLEGITTVDWL